MNDRTWTTATATTNGHTTSSNCMKHDAVFLCKCLCSHLLPCSVTVMDCHFYSNSLLSWPVVSLQQWSGSPSHLLHSSRTKMVFSIVFFQWDARRWSVVNKSINNFSVSKMPFGSKAAGYSFDGLDLPSIRIHTHTHAAYSPYSIILNKVYPKMHKLYFIRTIYERKEY